jgi:hypothetical protein
MCETDIQLIPYVHTKKFFITRCLTEINFYSMPVNVSRCKFTVRRKAYVAVPLYSACEGYHQDVLQVIQISFQWIELLLL